MFIKWKQYFFTAFANNTLFVVVTDLTGICGVFKLYGWYVPAMISLLILEMGWRNINAVLTES